MFVKMGWRKAKAAWWLRWRMEMRVGGGVRPTHARTHVTCVANVIK